MLPRWAVRAFRLGTLLGIAFNTAACARFSADAGMTAVDAITASELHTAVAKVTTDEDAADAAGRTRLLLRSPLTADRAVRLALLNNKGLQASYNELGIAEAVMVQASLPPSPRFSLSHISTPVELDIESRVIADIIALATLPQRAEIAAERFRRAQLRAALETLRLALQVKRSYYRAVGASQVAASLAQAASAAGVAAQLAKQLGTTGAMNKLDQAREDAFHADLLIQLAAARERAATERERLVRLMGLSGGELAFRLPAALPPLPRRRTFRSIEIDALRHRIDVQITRAELSALAKSYGLAHATRFVNLLELSGVARTQRESNASGTGGGAELEFEVPVFDFGEARLRQASEAYMQAFNRLQELVVNVRSEAREAYQRYRSSYDIADQYRTKVLPARQTISDETTLRYGAMQVDVFSLLTETQRRISATVAAAQAEENFWLANTDLDAAIIGGGQAEDRTPVPAAHSPDPAATE